MNRFEWVNATTVEQALGAVSDGSSYKAGGVDLLDLMKDGIASPQRLVNIREISALDGITENDKGLRLGPLVTLTQIEEHPLIQKKYVALSQAASRIATPQIRNMATVGGNLVQRPRCWYFRSEDFHCRKKGGTHCFAQDGENDYHAIFDNRVCAIIHPSGMAVPLVALDGRVEITSKKGKRQVRLEEVRLEEFFVSPTVDVMRENILEPGELITAILVPATGSRTAYYKQGEKESFDWPIADVAVALTMQGSRCSKASIVLGGAAPYPYRAKAAEAKLTNIELTEDAARGAAEAAMADATPLAKNAYKIPVFEAIIRRTILRAAGMSAEGVAA